MKIKATYAYLSNYNPMQYCIAEVEALGRNHPNAICDQISGNGSKSQMKSSVFQHAFNYISTYVYAFPEYLLYNFNNLSIKFHVML